MRAVHANRPNLSYPQIAKRFKRDHTTVMYHLDKTGRRHNRKRCRCEEHARRAALKSEG